MAETVTPADAVSQALARAASDSRRTVAYYGNVRGLPGSSRRPVRLLSEIGFPIDRSFSYVVPATSSVIKGDTARTIRSVTIHPYGLNDDYRRITSSRATDRRVHTSANPRSTGLIAYAENANYLISAEASDLTYSPAKTLRCVSAMATANRGPAYHFVITRRGDILVGAALDDETSASTRDSDQTIDVAMEGAFAIQREHHTSKTYEGNLIELPFTPIQVLTLSVLFVKLKTAYPDIASDLRYQFNGGDFNFAPRYNFSDKAWLGTRFNYSLSDTPGFFDNLARIAPFDLATQVFLTGPAPAPVASRAVAQTAIGQADTLGQQSVLLSNYAALAAPERSLSMQQAPRSQFFVERLNMAVRDADGASSAASDTAESGRRDPLTPSTQVEPHTYDYTTGRWGDWTPGKPF